MSYGQHQKYFIDEEGNREDVQDVGQKPGYGCSYSHPKHLRYYYGYTKIKCFADMDKVLDEKAWLDRDWETGF